MNKTPTTITDIEIVTVVIRRFANGKCQSAVMQRRGYNALSRMLKLVRNEDAADGMFDSEDAARAAAQQFIERIHPTQRFFCY